MLTGFQASTGAYITEDGDLLCERCFDDGGNYAKPISNYELDEWQTQNAEGWLDWDYLDEFVEVDGVKYALGPDYVWHVEGCACEPDLYDEAGHEIREAYLDLGCRQDDPREDEDDEIPGHDTPDGVGILR